MGGAVQGQACRQARSGYIPEMLLFPVNMKENREGTEDMVSRRNTGTTQCAVVQARTSTRMRGKQHAIGYRSRLAEIEEKEWCRFAWL